MKLCPLFIRCALIAVALLPACAKSPDSTPTASTDGAPAPAAEGPPAEAWWSHVSALCGKAFAGRLTSEDAVDADFADATMVMHIRRCEPARLEIPFHVDENRSRTWVLTRTDRGIQLQHDHRHEDGSKDVVTLYGGHTEEPGTEVSQYFPADDDSKQLFEANELNASVANVWSMEIVPSKRFSYILRRPERLFQVDFDLGQEVDPPPAPWGHE